MRFELKINLGDAAMLSQSDVAQALRNLATRLQADPGAHRTVRSERGAPIRDVNGNTVGSWQFTNEEG